MGNGGAFIETAGKKKKPKLHPKPENCHHRYLNHHFFKKWNTKELASLKAHIVLLYSN